VPLVAPNPDLSPPAGRGRKPLIPSPCWRGEG
jgi:hypothetical protein